jgi:RNA recognition motif-containing protein
MNIFVGNLAEEVSENDLREVFEKFGQVESVNILKDRFSGKSKGFGFLEMPSKDEAQTAIKETNGSDLKGAALRVDEAHPRPVGGARRGGGKRGGSGRRGGTGGRRGGSGGGHRGGRSDRRSY